MNALDPDRMTAAERLTEIGRILAIGYLRARNRTEHKNDVPQPENGEISLDLPVEQSGHAVAKNLYGDSQ